MEFFAPLGLLILPALYGSGAVLARQLMLRWGLGWRGLLWLGAAYGVLEEGLMLKSFFDPHWVDVGILGHYGRWAGVNWIWALSLTIYHSVVSIAIPVILAHLLYPQRRQQPWIGARGERALWLVLAAVAAFGFFAFTPYQPPLGPYVLAALLTLGMVWVARRERTATGAPAPAPRLRAAPAVLTALGFAFTVIFFGLTWGLPQSGVPAPMTLVLLLALVPLGGRVVRGLGGAALAASERHLLGLAAGPLVFFIVLAPLAALDPNRTDNPAGMGLVGLTAALILAGLFWRVGVRTASSAAQAVGQVSSSDPAWPGRQPYEGGQ